MTLLILAAGMGSRYGGLKQLDPIQDNGAFIIDYSVYDAIQAGFDHIVFLIKKEHLDDFRNTIGKRVEPHVKVDYAFQELTDVPEFVDVPSKRVKPWGTAHAVYCCRNIIDDAFAVINADDFYGRDAFRRIAAFLKNHSDSETPYPFCMAGFLLKNTLTEHGSVSRGICQTTSEGYLSKVVEHTKIQCNHGTVQYADGGAWHDISEDSVTSMNCWGFTRSFFDTLQEQVEQFFTDHADTLETAEFYLPFAVQTLIDCGMATVQVLSTDAKWHGVTYHEDKPAVTAAISEMTANGVYPAVLWEKEEG